MRAIPFVMFVLTTAYSMWCAAALTYYSMTDNVHHASIWAACLVLGISCQTLWFSAIHKEA